MIKRTIAMCGLSLALLSNLNAASTKTYQVTGPILELTDKTIVVQKATSAGKSPATKTPNRKASSKSARRSPSITG